MNVDSLLELYHSHRANCNICGIVLEAEGSLGDFFVLDTEGCFYCTQCDSHFLDSDERIFEPDLYLEGDTSGYSSRKHSTEKAQKRRDIAYRAATRKWRALPKRNDSVRAGIMKKSTLGKIHDASQRRPPKEYKHRRSDDVASDKLAEFSEEE